MSQSSRESPNSSKEWKSSQETEVESPESSQEFDEETFLATLTVQDGQPTLAPRERRTLRDELCIQCLEGMLGRRDITCLRDSDCPKCRHCQSLGRECYRVSHIKWMRQQYTDDVTASSSRSSSTMKSMRSATQLLKKDQISPEQR